MKILIYTIRGVLLLCIAWLPFNSMAQGSLEEGTIESQFEYLNRISNNYEEYKVVKKYNMTKMQSNVLDTLNTFRKNLAQLSAELKARDEEIEQLKSEVAAAQEELESTIAIQESIPFLGANMHKSTYNTLMLGIIAVLGIGLLFFIYRFNASFRIIADTNKTLSETREEFEQHRRNALERERKLSRQLIDERNKRLV